MTIQFRTAVRADFDDICQLFSNEQELFWIYPRASYPFNSKQLAELADARRDLTVAVNNKRIVGFANLYDFEGGSHAFIGNLVVSQQFRGNGLGRGLVEYMTKLVKKKYALPEVRISVFSENTKALLLYASCGFVPYQVEQRQDFTGKRVAILHLRAELS